MEGIITHNPELQHEAEVQSKAIYLPSGQPSRRSPATMPALQALTMDSFLMMSFGPYERIQHPAMGRVNAGSLHAGNSIRFVSTYSGFHGESELLWNIYRQAGLTGTPRVRASAFIRQCRSMPIVRHGRLPIGIMSRACRGRLKNITTARRRLCGLEPISVECAHNKSQTASSKCRHCMGCADTIRSVNMEPPYFSLRDHGKHTR